MLVFQWDLNNMASLTKEAEELIDQLYIELLNIDLNNPKNDEEFWFILDRSLKK